MAQCVKRQQINCISSKHIFNAEFCLLKLSFHNAITTATHRCKTKVISRELSINKFDYKTRSKKKSIRQCYVLRRNRISKLNRSNIFATVYSRNHQLFKRNIYVFFKEKNMFQEILIPGNCNSHEPSPFYIWTFFSNKRFIF